MTAIDPGTWTIKDILETLVVPGFVYLIRKIDKLGDKVDVLQTTITDNTADTKAIQTTLIGVDGRNGLRSRIRRLERKVEYMAVALAKLSGLSPLVPDSEDEEDDVQ